MQKYLLLCICLALCSCVSKKKYTETLSRQEAIADSTQTRMAREIDALRISVAEKRGANEALVATQDRLQDRLDALQLEIDRLSASSTNQRQNMSGQLATAEATIADKQARLAAVQKVFEQVNTRMQTIEQNIREGLREMAVSPEKIAFTSGKAQLSIDLAENLLFASGSTSRIEDEGSRVLQIINRALGEYPEMIVEVIGHTDNRPVNRKSLNNWQYTALRAVTVVELLTEQFGLGTNRVLAASKGEYSPSTSNETEEGRTRNRRIEIKITPDQLWLIRSVQKEIE